MTTLVTIGYHGMEREWGKIVRDRFVAQYQDMDDIIFHVVQCNLDENTSTGDPNPEADAEICGLIRGNGDIELLIDVHCGIIEDDDFELYHQDSGMPLDGKDLFYHGDQLLIKEMKRLYPYVDTNDKTGLTKAIIKAGIRIPIATPDYFMRESTYHPRNECFKEGIAWQVDLIREIYELHKNSH